MTRYDYNMVMKRLKIAEFKARLSEHLRSVRRGHSLIVMDRNTPIARVVPYLPTGEPLRVREPAQEYTALQKVPLPPRVKLKHDVVDLLLEERQGER